MKTSKKILTESEYVAFGGNKCPSCQSENIEGQGFDVGNDEVYQEIICNDCGATWSDKYKLVGYVDLDLSEG